MSGERELLLKVAAGSETAFREIFDQYFDRIYGVAFSLTKSAVIAEDMTQEIFTKIWIKRSVLPGIERFDAFLFRVARNHILNELRNKVKNEEFSEYLINYFRETGDNPQQQLIFRELEKVLGIAVKNLPPRQQEIYKLCREEGLSQEEVAKKLDISVNTIKRHMNEALRYIRHFYLLNYRLLVAFVISRILL